VKEEKGSIMGEYIKFWLAKELIPLAIIALLFLGIFVYAFVYASYIAIKAKIWQWARAGRSK